MPPMHPPPYMQGLSAGMAPVYIQAPLGTAMYRPPPFSATEPGLPPPYLLQMHHLHAQERRQ